MVMYEIWSLGCEPFEALKVQEVQHGHDTHLSSWQLHYYFYAKHIKHEDRLYMYTFMLQNICGSHG